MMIVTITIKVRIFSRFIILIKREKAYHKTIIFSGCIFYRTSIFFRLVTICCVCCMMVFVNDFESLFIDFKIIRIFIKVCVIHITVIDKMSSFVFLQQVIDIRIHFFVCSLINGISIHIYLNIRFEKIC